MSAYGQVALKDRPDLLNKAVVTSPCEQIHLSASVGIGLSVQELFRNSQSFMGVPLAKGKPASRQ
jgi:hypothetical protein